MERDATRYAEAWRRACGDARRREEARAVRAREILPELVRVLVESWGARRIVLIGSLASGHFRESSDIDLVVEGLSRPTFFDACAAVDRIAGEFRIDVVPLESARPFVRELLARGEGQVLYDAKS